MPGPFPPSLRGGSSRRLLPTADTSLLAAPMSPTAAMLSPRGGSGAAGGGGAQVSGPGMLAGGGVAGDEGLEHSPRPRSAAVGLSPGRGAGKPRWQ